MILFKSLLQYGKYIKKTRKLFFDILKNGILKNENKKISIAVKPFLGKIVFPSKIHTN